MAFAKRLIPSVFFLFRLGAAECDVTHVVPVRLVDEQQLETKVLQEAQGEAAWILRSLCVELEWVSTAEGKAIPMRILAGPLTPDIPEHSMGISLILQGRPIGGAVFLGRIQSRHRMYASEVKLPTLLGCILAHEIAHLLLGSSTHSSDGILKAQFGRAEAIKAGQRRLTFTDSDRLQLTENHRSVGQVERAELRSR